MYGMRSIVAHKYGVTEVNLNAVWGALTGPLEEDMVPMLDMKEVEKEDTRRDERLTLFLLNCDFVVNKAHRIFLTAHLPTPAK